MVEMKKISTLVRRSMRLALIVPFAALLYSPSPASAAVVPLGNAEPFAVLGASEVTNTTPTTINGDVGVYPGTSITGSGLITLIGASSFQQTTPLAMMGQADATTAFNTLAALPSTDNLTGQDLGTVGVLTPGVYTFDSTAQLTGTLTLNFAGMSDAEFVFQIGSSLTTASASDVVVENGNSTDAIYWEVGSSATLGTTTDFAGNIIADQSISLNTNAEILCGRAIALVAAVTLEDNTISNDCNAYNAGSGRTDFGSTGFSGVSSTTPVPEPASASILIAGLIGLAAWVRMRARQSF
jgi:type VI secretion system secreted protein VgrG